MQKVLGFVQEGNTTLTISGAAGTIAREVQGSFPGATITAYLAGTLTLASIYSDNALTAKANPFTSDSNGQFSFYAANGRYDIKFSGADIASPFTLGDFVLYDEAIIWIDVTAAPYLADSSGTNDSYTALAAAWTAALAVSGARAVIYIPPGQYKTASNWVASITGTTPKAVTILAYGATIVPTAAVTIALTLATASASDGYNSFLRVCGLKLDGDATTGATGILDGENAGDLSAAICLEDVDIRNFEGASSIGLDVRNVVNARFTRVYAGRNGTNLRVLGDDAGATLPTTVLFNNCQFREARSSTGGTGRGVVLTRGYQVVFRDVLIEANEREGLYSVTGATDNVVMCGLEDCWIEDNQAAGAITDYQVLLDGAALGTCMWSLKNVYFNGTPRSIYMRSVVNAILDQVYTRATANSLVIDTGVNGLIIAWPQNNVTYATAVTNGSPTTMLFRIVTPAQFLSTMTVTGAAAFSSTLSIADSLVGAQGANLNINIQPGNSSSGVGSLRDYQSNNILDWNQNRAAMDVRFVLALGTDTAAANDLTLPVDGNVFTITGNTQINAITTANWQGGPVYLRFSGTPTVKHNTAGGAGTSPILLQGSADLVCALNTVLMLIYDGANWQEVSRKTA